MFLEIFKNWAVGKLVKVFDSPGTMYSFLYFQKDIWTGTLVFNSNLPNKF
jgi:hypothetical protein